MTAINHAHKCFWRLTALFLFSFFFGFWLFNIVLMPQVAEAPSPKSTTTMSEENSGLITAQTPVRQEIYYTACRHLVSSYYQADSPFAGRSLQELINEGWTNFTDTNGTLVLSKNANGFCPTDDAKRHLQATANGVGIYHGPAGGGGELLWEYNLDITALPQETQEKIKSGKWEFATEQELYQTLDSWDEWIY